MNTSYVLYKDGEPVGEFGEVRHAKASKTQSVKRRNWSGQGNKKVRWTITKRSVEIVSEESVWEGLE